jgi:Zn-dependent metalloprotease
MTMRARVRAAGCIPAVILWIGIAGTARASEEAGVLAPLPENAVAGWAVRADASGTHFFADRIAGTGAILRRGGRDRVALRTARLDLDPLAAQAVGLLQDADGPLARLGFDRRCEFAPRSVLIDAMGAAHVRCDQTVDGARVFGGQVVVRIGVDGRVGAVNGVVLPVGEVETRPSLNPAQARAAVIAHFGREPVRLLDPAEPERMTEAGPRLAWRVPLHVASEEDGTANWEYFVDALDGRILLRYDDLKSDSPVTGDGVGVLGDLKSPLEFLQVQQGYALVDVTRRTGGANGGRMAADAAVETYDGLSLEDPNQVIQNARVIVSSTPHLRGAQGSVLRNAVDGHFNAARTYDYYLSTFDWNSWDNQGSSIYVVVNYGRFMNNAFWNGRFIAFGQGDGNTFIPLAGALDVTAHELTHAVTDATAALIYRNQSGALNESMSDVFGALVDRDDWTIGESIAGPGLGRAFLRSMADPALGAQPAHMNDYRAYGQDRDNGGVHTNSGIPNKAAYLFAEGGAFHGVTVVGQGRERLERVWFHALSAIMTSGSSFADAREATVQAARQVYADVPSVEAAARNAWAAVGIGQPAETNPTGRGEIGGQVGRPGGPMADVRVVVTNVANTMILGSTVPDPTTGRYVTEVANGSYRVFAFADANKNGEHEAGEPYGYHDHNANHQSDTGDAVTIHDFSAADIDIAIDESTGTAGLPAPAGLGAQNGARGGVPLDWDAPTGTGTGDDAPGGGSAGSLSGGISRRDGGAVAGAVIGLFRTGSSEVHAIATVPEGGSSYAFDNVAAGNYEIAAVLDIDGDGRITPGDMYGLYDANSDGQEDVVTVVANERLQGLDILLSIYGENQTSSVAGVITRDDAGNTAGTYAIFIPSDVEGDAAGSGADAPTGAGGAYSLAIDPGTYDAYAVLDRDENGMFNRGDWFGWREDPVTIGPGQNVSGVDMQMMEIPVDFFSEVESNDDPDLSDEVSTYSAVFAEVSPTGDEDWFSFQAAAGASIVLDVDAPNDPVLLDAYMELYNFELDDVPLAYSDDEDYPANVDPYIEGLLPADGTYYVRIRAYSEEENSTGPYTLYLLSAGGMRRPAGPSAAQWTRSAGAEVARAVRSAGRRARLIAPGKGIASIAGSPTGGAALLGYNIYRSISANVQTIPANRIANVPAETRTALDAQAQPGQTYHYVVTAVYDQGESAPSNEVAAAASAGGTPVACGDLNNSGGIDLSDVAAMMQALVDGNQGGFSDDVIDINRNGKIDVADAALITRAYGTGEPLECGPPAKRIEEESAPGLLNGDGAALPGMLSLSSDGAGVRVDPAGLRDLRALAFEFAAPAGAKPRASWNDGRPLDCFATVVPGIWRIVAAGYPALEIDPRGVRIDGARGDPVRLLKARGIGLDGRLRPIETRRAAEAPALESGLIAPKPNPAVATTVLSFSLLREGGIDLRIWDVAGRCIRRLAGGRWPAGGHEIVWDGRNDAGERVPAGLYFAGLHAGPGRDRVKIVLLRTDQGRGGAR